MMVPWWSLVSRGWCIMVIFIILLESVQVDLHDGMVSGRKCTYEKKIDRIYRIRTVSLQW